MSRAAYVRVPLRENRAHGGGAFVLSFAGCGFLAGTQPGQFVMLRADDWGTDPLLPRAFSVCAVHGAGETTAVDLLVKASGKASRRLERALPGASFSLLGPLGNHFAPPAPGRRDLLVAGGVGLAPLLMHASAAGRAGLADQVTLFYGGRRARDLVLLDRIRATGCAVVLATEDGSTGEPGYVTQAVDRFVDGEAGRPTLMACGPEAMLLATARIAHRRALACYLSLEGEMACGIGACLVCAVPCAGRPFRYTCKDGPVMDLAELRGPYAAEHRP